MTLDDIECLRQLFGAYFHQDWDLDAPDADGIIQVFISDHPNKKELSTLATLVESYVDARDDAQLEKLLNDELDSEYSPALAGIGAREWLLRVADQLRAASIGKQ